MSITETRDQLAVVEEWLFQTLAADSDLAALGIHADEVPEGEALPAIVYQYRGGSYLLGLGGAVIWANVVYLVKAIGQGRSTVALQPYTEKIKTRLHAQTGTTLNGGSVLQCVPEAPFKLAEYTDGEHYRHLGNMWRIYAQ